MNRNQSKRLFASDITGVITANRQQVDVEWRAGTLVIDEPKSNGGHDLGPDPFTMIVAGLVGCTLTTLRMYIRHKGWQIEDISVHANIIQQQDPVRTIILRTIELGLSVSDAQGERLLHIAKRCPAARLLEGEIIIDTVLHGRCSESQGDAEVT